MTFVDTGAWIALSNRRDQHHRDAVLVYNRLKQQTERLLTTDYIIDETATRLRYDANHLTAIKFLDLVERIESSGVLAVKPIDKILFREAKDLFRQYDSAVLSFTDCTSFVVCRRYRISEAFAFDQRFSIIGVILLK